MGLFAPRLSLLLLLMCFPDTASRSEETLVAGQGDLESAQCMNLAKVLALAVSHDPGVAASRAAMAQARAELTVARSLYHPQISTFVNSARGEQGLVASDLNNQMGLRVSQRVFDFGHARLSRQVARHDQAARGFAVRDEAGQAALDTRLRFIDWLHADANLQATLTRQQYFERERSALVKALDVGGATRAEVAYIAAEGVEAMNLRLLWQAQRSQAGEYLSLSTGQFVTPCIGEMGSTPFAGVTSDKPLTDLVDHAVLHSAHIKSLRQQLESERAKAKRQSRERYPVIELVGIVSMTADNRFATRESRHRFGFDVSVPLYSGMALKGRRQGAKAGVERARQQLLDAQRDLSNEVSSAYVQRELLLEQKRLNRHALEQRRLRFAALEEEYAAGLVTLSFLVDARLEFEDALISDLGVRHDLLRYQLRLKYLLGTLAQSK